MPPDITFNDFAVQINGLIAETGVEAIKELSSEVAAEVETLYYDFFGELYRTLSSGVNTTPPRFLSNIGEGGSWKPLSEKWSDRKISAGGSENFYMGLTAQLNVARRKASNRKRRQGKVRRTPRSRKTFMTFLNDLAGTSSENVKKFFGEIELKYAIRAKGRKTAINIDQVGNTITAITRITSHDDMGKMISNYDNVTLESDITLFPLLKTASAFSEWYVVSMMARKNGLNAKQWLKINSRFGKFHSERPIRAIITPLVSWYATTGITNALRRFYK